jgi:hypothetical protein
LIAAAFPGVNNLIGAIQKKKVKDNMILAVAIAFGICFLLYMFVLP